MARAELVGRFLLHALPKGLGAPLRPDGEAVECSARRRSARSSSCRLRSTSPSGRRPRAPGGVGLSATPAHAPGERDTAAPGRTGLCALSLMGRRRRAGWVCRLGEPGL